ncbi:MAG TPA: Ku protein, partial [Sporosarcina sp.]|nr:Ku protein [Sporosarcina sp.]
RSYFMAPDANGGKAYALLRKALKESGKIGVAKIIIRSKEQLAVVRVYKDALLMETIHFPDEVRNVGDVPNIPAEDTVVKKELDTALLLVDQLTTAFDPDKYTDEYRTALMELIEEKKAGNAAVAKTEKKAISPSNTTDLMAALQASLDKTKKKKSAPRKRTAAKMKA